MTEDEFSKFYEETFDLYYKHKYKEAAENCKKILNDKKYCAVGYGCIADCYFEKKDYLSALAYIEKALEHDPQNGSIYGEKARFLFRLKREAEALNTLFQGCQAVPKDFSCWLDLFDYYRKKGDSHRAMLYAKQGVKITRGEEYAWVLPYFVSEYLTKQARYTEAKAMLKRAINEDKDNIQGNIMREKMEDLEKRLSNKFIKKTFKKKRH